MWKWSRVAVIIFSIFCFSSASARAEDFKVLTRILYAADFADQADAYCTLVIPTFSDGTKGLLGSMRIYAEHIKREVTYDLRQIDALTIMLQAANAAKAQMVSVSKDIRTRDATNEAMLTLACCDDVAAPFIKGVIVAHDRDHAVIDMIMAKAKAR